MQKRHIGMLLDGPFQKPPAEKRLLGRALGDFDIGVYRAVLLVQRKACGIVFLSVADGNNRPG
jgi:hypothetical protein